MIQIGVMINNLGPNQLAYNLVNSGNRLLEKERYIDIVAFFQEIIQESSLPNFACMNMSESYDYPGYLISTDLQTSTILLNSVGTRKKYFYVWDLEWIRGQNKNYEALRQIYQNPNLKLIARSQPHKELIELAWNVSVLDVIEDCNMEKFYELFKRTQ